MPGKHPPKDRRHYYLVPMELGARLDRLALVTGRGAKNVANELLDRQIAIEEWTHREALRALPLSPHRWWCASTFRGHLCDTILGAGSHVMSRAHRWHYEESPTGITKWHDDDVIMDGGGRVPPTFYDRLRDKIANAGRGRDLIDLIALIEVETVLPEIVIADLCRIIGIAEDESALDAWGRSIPRLDVLAVVRRAMAIANGRADEDLEPDEEEVRAAREAAEAAKREEIATRPPAPKPIEELPLAAVRKAPWAR